MAAAILWTSAPLRAQVFEIRTLAGNPERVGDGGPAAGARLRYPEAITRDRVGNIYIADSNHHRIRKITTDGQITTICGTGTAGYGGDGGPGTAARLNYPNGLAVDDKGNLYISDAENNRIRRLTPEGVITTVTGQGSYVFGGDGGPAAAGLISFPTGLSIDPRGTLTFADSGNNAIRQISPNGILSTLTGHGECGYSGDGGPALNAKLCWPTGVATDAAGNVYAADWGNERVRRILPNGTISTIAGGRRGSSGDGGPAPEGTLADPWSVFVAGNGDLFIADSGNNKIRRIAQGIITTFAGSGTEGFAGDGGPARDAKLASPYSVIGDESGNLFVAERGNGVVRRIDASGNISTIAGSRDIGDGGAAGLCELGQPDATVPNPNGGLYIANGNLHRVRQVTTGETVSTAAGNGSFISTAWETRATAAAVPSPRSLAVDAAGALFIGAYGKIQKVGPDGRITTIAGGGSDWKISENATATSVGFVYESTGLAIDGAGNVYTGFQNPADHRILKIDTQGILTTFAGKREAGFSGDGRPAREAQINSARQIAFDAAGNLYIADRGNNRIRRVDTKGIITTVAGNGTAGFSGDGAAATAASLNAPAGVWVDGSGNVYIGDTGNQRVRKIDGNGNISTIAGKGTAGFSGDGGLAASAEFENPTWISVDKDGRVFVSDSVNERVRVLTPVASGACVLGLGPNGLSAGPAATSGSVSVTASLASCSWSARAEVPWITVSSVDSGKVNFQVAANPGREWRTGTIGIGALKFTVTQAGLPVPLIQTGGTVNAATFLQPVAPGAFATVFSAGLPEKGIFWDSAIPDGKTLPTSLGGVRVRVGGKDCFVSYAGPGQVNVLLPANVPIGLAEVEVFNAQGVDRARVNVTAAAPGFFTIGRYAAAQFVDGSLVSASRPAKAGDYLQLYVNGLGQTAEPYPVGRVFEQAYPIAELSRVRVSVGGLPAAVSYAGMIAPGLFQVNVRVPDDVAAGELPVQLSVDGQQTQAGVVLAFAR